MAPGLTHHPHPRVPRSRATDGHALRPRSALGCPTPGLRGSDLNDPLALRCEPQNILSQSAGRFLSFPRDQEARMQEASMWFWWPIWFDWWFPPSPPTHDVIAVDFSRKRVIKRLAS